jgi:hypothetical protein
MKSLKAIVFMLCTLFFVTSALAQEWTKEQAELWGEIEASWMKWKDGDIDGALAGFHSDYLGWGSEYPMPADKAKITKWWNMMKDNYKVMMLDLTPVRIAVVGDAAVAHYYFSFYGMRMGKEEAVQGKNTEFYVKENGKWLLLGDHTSTKSEEEDDD